MGNLVETHVLNATEIKAAIDAYEHCLPDGATRKGYMSDLRIFYGYLTARGLVDAAVSDIGQADIQIFADEQKKAISPTTLRRRLSVLRSFFAWAVSEGYAEDNPARKVRLPTKSETYPTYLTKQEVHRLLQMPNLRTSIGIRDRCIMSLLYYAGLRISELCSLTVSSVRPEHFRYKQNLVPAVIIRDGKGGKDRAIPLSSEEAYGDYLAWEKKRARMKAGHDALFLNKLGEPITAKGVNYLVKKYAEKAGIDKRVSPHTLRHTFATHLAMEGTRLDLIQSYLGHSDLRSTQVYAHITDDEYATGVDSLISLGRKARVF